MYLEALSQSLPIVGVVNEGIYGISQEDNLGRFLDNVDVKSICKIIIDMLQNLSKYSLCENTFFESFRWKNISDKYIIMYNQIRKE